MANYHIHFNLVKASNGKNIIKEAAYLRATKLYDEKEMIYWEDLKNKEVHVHAEILIPDNAPLWAKEIVTIHPTNPNLAAERLWNKVSFAEKRIDAQFARTIELSLPLELTQEQNLILAREFIFDQFVSLGMIADLSVHWKENNPHVHALLTLRELTPEGFGKKVREWNSKKLTRSWRKKWEDYQNYHLKLNHHTVRVDHRSYKDQGIDLIPMRHQGDYATSLANKGIIVDVVKENNHIREKNLARIAAKPSIVQGLLSKQKETYTHEDVLQILGRYDRSKSKFSYEEAGIFSSIPTEKNQTADPSLPIELMHKILNSIEHHNAVFSEKELAKAVTEVTDDLETFTKAVIQIKQLPDVIHLGPGDDGRNRYITKGMLQLENMIQKLSDELSIKTHVEISPEEIEKALKKHENSLGKKLTPGQRKAIHFITGKKALACMVGRAGTGKSFSLGAAKAVWESCGLRVRGIALSGIAADGMNKDARIESQTIESFRYCINQGLLNINHTDVWVMDEAGMTESVAMEFVLKSIKKAKAKLVLVGDAAQLQPVGPGATFKSLLDRLSYVEIKKVYRQKGWQAKATLEFSAGNMAKGLKDYEDHQRINLEKTADQALNKLILDWVKQRATSKSELSDFLVVAHRNEDVKQLNERLRNDRILKKEITEGYRVKTAQGEIKIAPGERLLFLKNKRQIGIFNGRFATVKKVDFTETGNVISLTVVLDGKDPTEITLNPLEFNQFTYGYAATVHKVQGMTVDYSFVYAGGAFWNRHLTYVAMTRHRKSCNLYASEEQHLTLEKLKRNLSQYSLKEIIMDFGLMLEKYGIDSDYLTDILPEHLAKPYSDLKQTIKNKIQEFLDPQKHQTKQKKTSGPSDKRCCFK